MSEFDSNGAAIPVKKIALLATLIGVVLCLLWVFYGFRVTVPQNHILVLTRRFGEATPPSRILAEEGQKGVQYRVMSEGWHWYSWFLWGREIHPATIIKASEMGVMVRQYGNQLEQGKILATPYNSKEMQPEDTKGIVPQVLKPGKYNVNPYAYKVEKFPVREVPAGHVGVVIRKIGKDSSKFDYLAPGPEYKGILRAAKEPGTYYLNPYMYDVFPYNIRVQKTDFKDREISFMSYDSYEVRLSATIEWKVDRKQAPLVYARTGTLEDVEKKLIYPYARSLFRIIGSRSKAKEYISGETRQEIQERFETMLRDTLSSFGVQVSSVVIRQIRPPTVLREIINTRGLEKEKRAKILADIEKVKSDAQVAKRREEIKQSQARVEEDIQRQMALIEVKGDREIALQDAERRRSIAKLDLDSAKVERDTIVEKGRAQLLEEFNVRAAQAHALASQIQAAGGGAAFAAHEFARRLRIEGVLSNDQSELAEILKRLARPAKSSVEVQR